MSYLEDEAVPAHSLEMEMSALGSMILDERIAEELNCILSAEDFYRPAHREIFRSLQGLIAKARPIDFLTLKEELMARDKFQEVGGEEYLIQVAEFVPSAANGAYYAQIVIDKATTRMLDEAGRSIIGSANSLDEQTIDAKVANAEARLREIGTKVRLRSNATPYFKRYKQSEMRDWPDMEWLIKDLLPKTGLGMIYGPPGNGKTFVVIDLGCAVVKGNFLFAKEFGVRDSKVVVYAAGEKMHGIPKRMQASCKKWGLTPEEEDRFDVVENVPQLFDTEAEGSTSRFIDFMKVLYPGGIGLLFIDTLHMATIGGEENSGRDVNIEIAAAKRIQKALGCALIIVHHTGAAGQRERGHTSWYGSVEMKLRIDKEVDSDRPWQGALIMNVEKVADAEDGFALRAKLVEVEGVSSRAIEWEGRSQATKDLNAECLRILKNYYAKWITGKQVWEDVTIENTTERAVVTCLNRLSALGSARTGVFRKLQDAAKKASRLNPNVFTYDRSSIAPEAEEIPPAPEPQADEPYDPFADE